MAQLLQTFWANMSKLAKEFYSVLVADDSVDDRFLLKDAMSRATKLRIVGEVTDGTHVIGYLKGDGHFSDREKHPLPDLLLLDLKMPRKDGFQVLEWLRSNLEHDLTVVVLTDSMQPEHIKRALELGADLFQVKPRNTTDRHAMILALEEHLVKQSLRAAVPVRPVPTTIAAY